MRNTHYYNQKYVINNFSQAWSKEKLFVGIWATNHALTRSYALPNELKRSSFWSGHMLILRVTGTLCSAEINNDDSIMFENKWQKRVHRKSSNVIKKMNNAKFDYFCGLIDQGDAFYRLVYFKFLWLVARIVRTHPVQQFFLVLYSNRCFRINQMV